MDRNQKLSALQAAVGQIEKSHGKGAIMQLGDHTQVEIEVIPTGSLALDIALGIGGIPRGRICEIYGPESSGKTTFCYELIAQAQKKGGLCAFIDTEHAMDPGYAATLGVDVDSLWVAQPDSGEQALDMAETLVRSGAVDLLVIDSVAALVPQAELDGEIGDSLPGIQARMMSKALRKIAGVANQSKTTIVFTNQLREKIGIMFGSPETTPGGKSLKFYASIRLDIRRIRTNKVGDTPVSNTVRVKVVKNKMAPPFRQAEFDITFGQGYDRYSALLNLGCDKEIAAIEKNGAFYTMPDGAKLQGAAKAAQYLADNAEVAEGIEAKVRAVKLATGKPADEPEAAPAED